MMLSRSTTSTSSGRSRSSGSSGSSGSSRSTWARSWSNGSSVSSGIRGGISRSSSSSSKSSSGVDRKKKGRSSHIQLIGYLAIFKPTTLEPSYKIHGLWFCTDKCSNLNTPLDIATCTNYLKMKQSKIDIKTLKDLQKYWATHRILSRQNTKELGLWQYEFCKHGSFFDMKDYYKVSIHAYKYVMKDLQRHLSNKYTIDQKSQVKIPIIWNIKTNRFKIPSYIDPKCFRKADN